MTTPASSEPDFVDELAELLSSARAKATISRARLARSTLYDPQYHIAVIACAMRIHSERPHHRILASWLKLLQFIAARPTLVDQFIGYAGARRAGDLELWQQMPRGYLGDETHEGVMNLLVASGMLRKVGDAIEASSRYSMLAQLVDRIELDGLFSGERAILQRLRSVKVTKVLLGAS